MLPFLEVVHAITVGVAGLAMDANGIWMNLLKLALALYTEQWALASRLLNYAPVRFIANQTRNASGMPLNFADSINQANAWVILARLSAFAGHDLARYQGVQGESIAALLAQIGQTGPESPEWRARPEHYALWHSRLNALLMGETQPYSPIDSADLMPVAWQLLAEPVQSGP
jgi:hypothetical protein